MLASSFFFGKSVRDKREKELRLSSKESASAIHNFRSDFITPAYISYG
uniref:Uncharacterized protein n=1 Tax=Heterorhabditis bacteriophora TaxID=37862 RepID=A0A1I7WVK4_HETBA